MPLGKSLDCLVEFLPRFRTILGSCVLVGQLGDLSCLQGPLSSCGCFCSVVKLCLTLKSHGLHHSGPPCPSPSSRVQQSSYPLNWRCHPIISFSVTLFSFCFESFTESGSFPTSQLFASGGQSIGASASASVLFNEYSGFISFRIDWFDLAVQGTLKSLL